MTMQENVKHAVCLFSGGLDSTTTLYYAIRNGFTPLALTVHYGQIHEREIAAASEIARRLNVKHEVVNVGLPWRGSALLDRAIAIPQDRSAESMSAEIPATYVPARNTIFLSLAASYAEAKGADTIFIGANAIDYSGYPDCRPNYLNAFESMVQLGTKAGVEGRQIRIEAPLIQLSKADIVRLGHALGVPFELTWSCYAGGEAPCGKCDSCILRAKGFEEVGINDPAISPEALATNG